MALVRQGFIAFAVLMSACTGDIQSDNVAGLPPKEQFAFQMWEEKAIPVFQARCMMCHDGSMPMIGYLAGATSKEKRDTLINYMPAVVNLGAPQSSRILTKGNHTGPALLVNESTDILTWILAERDARPEIAPIRSQQFTPMLCTSGNPGDAMCPINTVDIMGLSVPATMSMVITPLTTDLYITNIKLKGGASGVYAAHPLIETWPAGATEPTPDPIDRWFNVVLNLAPNAEADVGTGEGSFKDFKGTDPLSVRFDIFEMQHAM